MSALLGALFIIAMYQAVAGYACDKFIQFVKWVRS